MYKGGRPKDPVWQHFVEIRVNNKVYAKCKYCGNQQLPKAGRLNSHHEKCNGIECPQVRQRDSSPLRKRARSTSPPPAKCQAVPTPVPVISLQPSMDSKVTKTSVSHKHAIDVKIARLFYACNLPFNVRRRKVSTISTG